MIIKCIQVDPRYMRYLYFVESYHRWVAEEDIIRTLDIFPDEQVIMRSFNDLVKIYSTKLAVKYSNRIR